MCLKNSLDVRLLFILSFLRCTSLSFTLSSSLSCNENSLCLFLYLRTLPEYYCLLGLIKLVLVSLSLLLSKSTRTLVKRSQFYTHAHDVTRDWLTSVSHENNTQGCDSVMLELQVLQCFVTYSQTHSPYMLLTVTHSPSVSHCHSCSLHVTCVWGSRGIIAILSSKVTPYFNTMIFC